MPEWKNLQNTGMKKSKSEVNAYKQVSSNNVSSDNYCSQNLEIPKNV